MDLDYPEDLHVLHQDMPLAPEHIEITKDLVCPLMREMDHPIGYKARKLVGTFKSKKKYVVHYKLLQLYLKLGLKLRKVRKVLKFSQSPFMREYISYLETLWESLSEFEKLF